MRGLTSVTNHFCEHYNKLNWRVLQSKSSIIYINQKRDTDRISKTNDSINKERQRESSIQTSSTTQFEI